MQGGLERASLALLPKAPGKRRDTQIPMPDTSSPASAKKPFEIVVGFDFSPLAERAFEEALEIAEKRAPAELHVVTVAQPAGMLVRLPGEADGISEELARETVRLRIGQILEEHRARVGAIRLERVAVYVLTGSVVHGTGRTIVELACSVEANLVVVGAHARMDHSTALLGSVAQQVVSEASASVYVVRPPELARETEASDQEAPLDFGPSSLRHLEHRRTYHYVERTLRRANRTVPVS